MKANEARGSIARADRKKINATGKNGMNASSSVGRRNAEPQKPLQVPGATLVVLRVMSGDAKPTRN